MNGKEMDREESTKELLSHVVLKVDLCTLLWPAKTVLQVLSNYCSDHVVSGEGLSIDELAGVGHVLEMLAEKMDGIDETLGEIKEEILRLRPLEG